MARIDNLTNFLTDVATAIKDKTGKADTITPANFDTEIASIQSGGGDTTREDGLIDGTLTELSNDRITKVRDGLFYKGEYSSNTKLKSVNLPNAKEVCSKAFYKCTALTTVNLPNVTTIWDSTFYECSSITNLNIPKLTTIQGMSGFESCSNITNLDLPNLSGISSKTFCYCSKLVSVDFPKVQTVAMNAFQGCIALTTVNLPLVTEIGTYAFSSCSNLGKVILRSETVCTLNGTNAFNSTPIVSGTGYIYVPDALVDSYKSATNWSAYANQIKPISELEAN
jgi:hypothetical protein